jgi:hypothetical protein
LHLLGCGWRQLGAEPRKIRKSGSQLVGEAQQIRSGRTTSSSAISRQLMPRQHPQDFELALVRPAGSALDRRVGRGGSRPEVPARARSLLWARSITLLVLNPR